MKFIITALFIVASIVSFVMGNIPFSIWSAVGAVITILLPASSAAKTPDEFVRAASGLDRSGFNVVFGFKSDETNKTFDAFIETVDSHEDNIMRLLVKNIDKATGIKGLETSPERLKIISITER